MTGAVYGADLHQSRVATHRKTPICDLTTSRRCRVIAHVGTWDGRDHLPVDAL